MLHASHISNKTFSGTLLTKNWLVVKNFAGILHNGSKMIFKPFWAICSTKYVKSKIFT